MSTGEALVILIFPLIGMAAFAAYITSLWWAILAMINNDSIGHIALGIAGAVVPPIGVIHGVMLWLGVG